MRRPGPWPAGRPCTTTRRWSRRQLDRSRGIMANSWSVNPTIWLSIQWPANTSTRATPIIFGTKTSVISCTCVTDWTSEITRPIARLVARMGPATFATRIRACRTISMTLVSVMALPVTRDQRLDDERPAVDEHEQEDLERQRHQDRRQHHHAHRHERRAHDEVDHEERHEHHEPDDERRLELRQHERGDELGHAGLVRRGRLWLAAVVDEQRQLRRARL